MIQFYSPEITTTHALGLEESVHCVRVLRKKEGDRIAVTDGKGTLYQCEILKADTRGVKLRVISEERKTKSWNYILTVAVAPTKNADRMAWLVEKCTEIGVDRIVFMSCRYSERKTVNVERLRRNAISAMNQSLKVYLPEITEMVALDDILGYDGEKYFGYCDDRSERLEFVKEYTAGKDVTIAIGPEGDFSKEEVQQLRGSGYKAVTFGNERLRTETAAIYGVAAVHVLNDLKEE